MEAIMSEEKVYLDEGVIKVTSSRVVLGDKNFVLRNIPSVSVHCDQNGQFGIIFGVVCIGAGLFFLYLSSSVSIQSFFISAGLFFLIVGAILIFFLKTHYYVLIGELNRTGSLALKSPDEETPKRVVAAINEALVELDKNEHNANVASTADSTPQDTSADDLTKFKKMLDDGLITQEDYDAKKKQILGL